MGILADWQIQHHVFKNSMIEPAPKSLVSEIDGRKVISFGVTSYGYDARLANEFKVFHNAFGGVVDPKNFDERSFVEVSNVAWLDIPPNSFVLGRSVEYFKIPRDILAICIGKSTYARCGIIVNVTPLEPEWEGHVTIEISNTTPLPARVYPNEGIMQVVFLYGDGQCAVSYADRKGKYQKQTGIVTPR